MHSGTVVSVAVTLCAVLGNLYAQEAPYDSVWALVKGEHDKNQDGQVTKSEYTRGEERFARLDRNQDGVLTEADFASGENRRNRPAAPNPGDRRGRMLGMLLTVSSDAPLTREAFDREVKNIDKDGDGRISRSELAACVPMRTATRALNLLDTDESGDVSAQEMGEAFASADANKDGKLSSAEVSGGPPAGGRAAGRGTAPEVGQMAPDFTIPVKGDNTQLVTLSAFREKKPVALIFGSYT